MHTFAATRFLRCVAYLLRCRQRARSKNWMEPLALQFCGYPGRNATYWLREQLLSVYYVARLGHFSVMPSGGA